MLQTTAQGPTAMTYDFQIPNMSCGHCVRAITEAVKAADPQAQVSTDLPNHQVQVDSTVPREQVVARLTEAGYAPA
jgi:copper chaperone